MIPFNAAVHTSDGTIAFSRNNASTSALSIQPPKLGSDFGLKILHRSPEAPEIIRFPHQNANENPNGTSFCNFFKKPKDHYFLRAESFYNVATDTDQTGYLEGYGGKSLHGRSHGEAFMATLTQKLRGKRFYILDEPEAALSPTRRMAALSAIHLLVEDESQFIIATHSPILPAYPRSRILLPDKYGITEVEYEDTEHYSITKEFLNNHQKMIELLTGI